MRQSTATKRRAIPVHRRTSFNAPDDFRASTDDHNAQQRRWRRSGADVCIVRGAYAGYGTRARTEVSTIFSWTDLRMPCRCVGPELLNCAALIRNYNRQGLSCPDRCSARRMPIESSSLPAHWFERYLMSNAKPHAANLPGARLPRNERPRSVKASLLVAAAVTFSVAAQTPARTAPLPAPVRPVVDTYHGVQVIDPYRWLERWDDSEVKAWTEAQNTYTHAQLDALPFMAALRARVQAVGADTHPRWSSLAYRRGRLFAIKQQPPHE